MKQTSRNLGVHPETVRGWVKRGEIPGPAEKMLQVFLNVKEGRDPLDNLWVEW